MKYLKTGKISFGIVTLVLVAWVNLIKYRYSGFIVNFNNLDEVNILVVLFSSIIIYPIFIVANWAIAVLIDGKGDMKTIFKVNMYSLYPSVFLITAGVLLSRIMIIEEKGFILFLFVLPIVIYVMYTFIGLVTVHQYTFTKGVASILLSFIAMAIIIFISVLLYTLVGGFIKDMLTIFDEILLHL